METVRMTAPPGTTSCSHAGITYTVDETGHVTVPAIAVEALQAFGFAPVDPSLAAAAVKKANTLERMIAEAPRAILSHGPLAMPIDRWRFPQWRPLTIDRCVKIICANFPNVDRTVVLARITEGMEELKAQDQAKINSDAAAAANAAKSVLTRYTDLGWPGRIEHPGRGPKPKGTQYDRARKHRCKALYNEQTLIPIRQSWLPLAGAASRRKIGDIRRKTLRLAIRTIQAHSDLMALPENRRTSFVIKQFDKKPLLRGLRDRKAITSMMRELGFLPQRRQAELAH